MRLLNFQPKGVQAPREVVGNLPNNHFIGLIYASKGMGKTNLLLNMVKQYDHTKFFQRVFLFSPSYESDPKYQVLNDGSYELQVYNDFNNDIFQDVIDDIKEGLEEWKQYQIRKKLYEKFQKAKDLGKFTEEELFELYDMDYEPPTCRFQKEPFSLIIYDDLASNAQLMKQGKSIANQFALRTRHFRTSIIYVVQQYKNAVPKMIRNNTDLWVLAKSKSDKDMMAVAEELSSYLSPKEVISLWEKSTSEPYSYFVVNLMASPDKRFTTNFDEPILAKLEESPRLPPASEGSS